MKVLEVSFQDQRLDIDYRRILLRERFGGLEAGEHVRLFEYDGVQGEDSFFCEAVLKVETEGEWAGMFVAEPIDGPWTYVNESQANALRTSAIKPDVGGN
jgi:hypothetical protein